MNPSAAAFSPITVLASHFSLRSSTRGRSSRASSGPAITSGPVAVMWKASARGVTRHCFYRTHASLEPVMPQVIAFVAVMPKASAFVPRREPSLCRSPVAVMPKASA